MLKTFHFLLLLVPFILKAQVVDSSSENYQVYFYDNGVISSEGLLIDGKPNGYWITYYDNNEKKSEGNRVNFLLSGRWKFYTEEGKLKNTIEYKNGIKEGDYNYYDSSVFLIKKEHYTDGVKNGLEYHLYPDSSNDVIKKTIPFEEGKENGIAFEYAKDGRIITIISYKNGFKLSTEKLNRTDNLGRKQGVWKKYYEENGRLKKEERYKDDLLNGYVKLYNKEGKLEEAILYINGERQNQEDNLADFNTENMYFEDGSIKSTIFYNLAGKKDGVSTYYNKEGEVRASEIYKNGYLIKKGIIDKKGFAQGIWETYYLNGKLKSKGAYKNGKKFGKWTYYYSNDKIEQEGFYDENGKYTGEWKWYYEDGSLLRKENYRRGVEDGMLVEYDRQGKLITEGEYYEGEKEGVWVYELNDHIENGKYRYGERDGNWEFKYPNGKLSFEGKYLEGIPDGKHKYYSKEGVLIREENYSYGKKDGKWKWYDSEGFEVMSIEYDDGEEKKINGKRVKFSTN